MANANSAWGVEIGSFGIKAIRLEKKGSGVKVTDFAVIPHSSVLSGPDVDVDEVVRISLGQFVSQKIVDKQRVAISVPGNVAFSAFTRLPPHEAKQTPNLVRFEAEQQIPFPISEVEWDYKTFQSEDSPEVEVGIFALQRSVLDDRLGLYSELGVEPDLVTVSPLALFNAISYDLDLQANSKPVVILDIATRHSDLIVAEGGRCWFRRLPVGGHNFTMAISEAFKISYAKAELLKQEGATGKYAKQVMQAMRPIFTELLDSVQRSLEYYKTASSLDTVIGVGSTFRIPGLRRFLGTQLQKDVIRLDEPRKIRVEGPDAAAFATNTVNLWTAYGLALQEIGGGEINVNLAPAEVLRQQMWSAKKSWFVAAAVVAFIAGGAMFLRPLLDSTGLRSGKEAALQEVKNVDNAQRRFKSELDEIMSLATGGSLGQSLVQLDDYRRVWPGIVQDVNLAVASGTDPELLKMTPEQIVKTTASNRRLTLLEGLSGRYTVEGGGTQAKRFIDLTVEVAYSNSATDFLNTTVCDWLRNRAQQPPTDYRIVPDSISYNPSQIVSQIVTADGTKVADSGSRNSKGNSKRPGSSSSAGQGTMLDSGTDSGPSGGGGQKVLGPSNEKFDSGTSATNFGAGGGSAGRGSSSVADMAEASSGRNSGGAASAISKELGDLNNIAPIPSEPMLYKLGSTFYSGVITFRVEILEPNADNGGGSS